MSMGLGMGMGMGMAHSSGGRQLSFSLFDNRHAADHWRTPLLCVLSDAQFYFASSKCDRERERKRGRATDNGWLSPLAHTAAF